MLISLYYTVVKDVDVAQYFLQRDIDQYSQLFQSALFFYASVGPHKQSDLYRSIYLHLTIVLYVHLNKHCLQKQLTVQFYPPLPPRDLAIIYFSKTDLVLTFFFLSNKTYSFNIHVLYFNIKPNLYCD